MKVAHVPRSVSKHLQMDIHFQLDHHFHNILFHQIYNLRFNHLPRSQYGTRHYS